MKRNELKCPTCRGVTEDLKESVKCNSCNKSYQVSLSKKGVNSFLFIFVPSCFLVSSMVVLDWKVPDFLDMPNREMPLYGAIAFGIFGLYFALAVIKKEFIIGKEIETDPRKS